MNADEYTVRVWDPLVRIGHWTLVAAFFTAYLTEDDFMSQHVWAGYVVGTVVAIRIVWGFIGSGNARFVNFVRSPRPTFSYLFSLFRGKAPRHIGHNPAGAAMIVAILLFLSGTVYSGLVLYAVEENAGPLAGLVTDRGETTEEAHEELEEFWEETHEILVNTTLLLVIIHVLGVLGSSYLHKENLVRAMLSGRKRGSAD